MLMNNKISYIDTIIYIIWQYSTVRRKHGNNTEKYPSREGRFIKFSYLFTRLNKL